MQKLAELLDNHRLEVLKLQEELEDLKAFKYLAVELANRKGFDSVALAIDSLGFCECACRIENKVMYKMLCELWPKTNKPVDLAIKENLDICMQKG